ncbi:creatininase family protein [bacterium]|nr:creatininase family protein [bacterium]
MTGRPYILFETNWKTVKATDYDVAVLPWGAIEAHNYHLPYGTDAIQSEYIAAESARVAWEKGEKVIVLPAVPFGVNTGQLAVRLDINIYPSTQAAILRDVAQSLFIQGFRKLVVLNGHGGNEFKPIIREIQATYPDMFLCLINWYQVFKQEQFFKDLGEHGGEMETSNLMVISPDWVLPLHEAGKGRVKPFKLRGLREGLAWAQRDWLKATTDTGIGNPAEASAEKGRRYLNALADAIGAFLVDLARADIKEDLYET